MSCDTTYNITFKGKRQDLRQAAVAYVRLLLAPWCLGQRDQKTITRLEVFRNENNCSGLMDPPSLCEKAAKLFPGVAIAYLSNDEYGQENEGEWLESASAPENATEVVGQQVLGEIPQTIKVPHHRLRWLEALSKWAEAQSLSDELRGKIAAALEEAQQAEREAEIAQANAEAEKARILQEGRQHLKEMTRWRFHASDLGDGALEATCVATCLYEGMAFFAAADYSQGWSTRLRAVHVSDGTKAWELELPARFESAGTVDFTNRALFVSTNGTLFVSGAVKGGGIILYGISAKDGSLKWEHALQVKECYYNGCASDSSIVIATRTVAEETIDGRIVAIDENTGRTVWQIKPESAPGFVVGDGERLYVSDAGHIRAFNYQGEMQWAMPAPATWRADYEYTRDDASISDTGSLIITVTHKGSMALSCTDGKELWRVEDEDTGCAPSIGTRNQVFFINTKGIMTARDATTGELIWESAIGEPAYCTPAHSKSGVLFFLGTENYCAVDSTSHKLLWRLPLKKFWGHAQVKVILCPDGSSLLVAKGRRAEAAEAPATTPRGCTV